MKEITGFRRDILYTLLGTDEPSGAEINEMLEDHYSGTVYHGRLYDNLDTLIERDFVVKSQIDGRTNSYKLTDKGERAILDHHNWQAGFVDESEPPLAAD